MRYFLLSSLLFAHICVAQPPEMLWSRTYGTPGHDQWITLFENENSDIALFHDGNADTTVPVDIWLVTINQIGDTLWSRQYGLLGNDYAPEVTRTIDDGFIIATLSGSFPELNCSPTWVIRTDSNGDTLWTRAYCPYPRCQPMEIVANTDGSFVICIHHRLAGGQAVGFGLLWIDSSGDSLQFADFPDIDNISSRDPWCMVQADNGDFIVCGQGDDLSLDPPVIGDSPWAIRIDNSGNVIWQQFFRVGHSVLSCLETYDGNYFLTVLDSLSDGREDFRFLKIDGNGNIIWDRSYGSAYFEQATSADQCSDSGFIVLGHTNVDAVTYLPTLLRLDSGGDSLWTIVYGTPRRGAAYHASVIQTNDGGYLAATESYLFSQSNFSDILLVKFAADGLPVSPNSPTIPNSLSISAYPNPFNPTTEITFDVPRTGRATLKVYDLLGREVAVLLDRVVSSGVRTVVWNAGEFSSGIYFLRLGVGGDVGVRKVVLIR